MKTMHSFAIFYAFTASAILAAFCFFITADAAPLQSEMTSGYALRSEAAFQNGTSLESKAAPQNNDKGKDQAQEEKTKKKKAAAQEK